MKASIVLFLVLLIINDSARSDSLEIDELREFAVPFSVNRKYLPSGMKVIASTAEFDKPLSKYLQEHEHSINTMLRRILSFNGEKEFSEFESMVDISVRGSNISKMIFDQLLLVKNKGVFEKSILKYKIFLGDDILYLVISNHQGKHIPILFPFVKREEGFFFKPIIGDNLLTLLSSISRLNYSTKEKDKGSYIKIAPHVTDIPNLVMVHDGYKPAYISYDWITLINMNLNDFKAKLDRNKSGRQIALKNIARLYSQINHELSSFNYDGAFSFMEKDAPSKFRWKKAREEVQKQQLSSFIKMRTAPKFINFIVKSGSFYIVYHGVRPMPGEEFNIQNIAKYEGNLQQLVLFENDEGDLEVVSISRHDATKEFLLDQKIWRALASKARQM